MLGGGVKKELDVVQREELLKGVARGRGFCSGGGGYILG